MRKPLIIAIFAFEKTIAESQGAYCIFKKVRIANKIEALQQISPKTLQGISTNINFIKLFAFLLDFLTTTVYIKYIGTTDRNYKPTTSYNY